MGIGGGASVDEYYSNLLGKYPLSDPITLGPGDATVHNGATLHSAPKNTTDEIRWIYNAVMFPARATWTGEVFWPNEGTEMQVGETFPDFRFPVLA